ncbi:MAG: hypothetical protein LBU65_15425 [Planctomycetaceae bacterium]|jgi:hypothetical protein|nr:hypothetical protein [Planctomycetaceae bacterium]
MPTPDETPIPTPDMPDETFFDRERWRLVGDDLKKVPPEREGYLQSIGLSPSTLTILLVVVLLSGIGGIIAITNLPPFLFTYNAERYVLQNDPRQIPSQWVGYHETQTLAVNVERVTCFCATSERFFVGADSQIVVFGHDGQQVGAVSLSEQPTAILFSENEKFLHNKLLVVFQDRVEIFTFGDADSANTENRMNATQQNVWQFDDGNRLYLTSIAISDDAAYIADAGKRMIFKCNQSGRITKQFGAAPPPTTLHQTSSQQTSYTASETAPPLFAGFAEVSPMFLSVTFSAKDNVVYVTNPGRCRVETFDADGTWKAELSWGDASSNFTGFCGTSNPVGLATLADGRVVTVERAINRVKVYETNGRIATVVASPNQLENFPTEKIEAAKQNLRRNAYPDSLTKPLYVSVVNDQVVLFDPIFQLVRVFQSNSTPNNPTVIIEEKPSDEIEEPTDKVEEPDRDVVN